MDDPVPSRETGAGTLPPGLHVVATPIGNLGDLSPRAAAALAGADLVLCEDTRVTGKLFTRFGISARKQPYNDHNAAESRPGILARLREGAVVALVSDAGTPLISDPGYKLVREAAEAGIAVHAVPGPSAVMAALAVAGLPTDRFLFAGFLPPKDAARRREIVELAPIRATLVLFEAVHRLAETLADLATVLGQRPAAVCRELTKLHEEVRRGSLSELAEHYAASGPPKGEAVIVVGPPGAEAAGADVPDLDGALRAALARTRLKQAVAEVAAATGLPRREVYARALALSGGGDSDGDDAA